MRCANNCGLKKNQSGTFPTNGKCCTLKSCTTKVDKNVKLYNLMQPLMWNWKLLRWEFLIFNQILPNLYYLSGFFGNPNRTTGTFLESPKLFLFEMFLCWERVLLHLHESGFTKTYKNGFQMLKLFFLKIKSFHSLQRAHSWVLSLLSNKSSHGRSNMTFYDSYIVVEVK